MQHATTYVRILRTVYDGLKKKGIIDLYFGRKVRGLVEQFGLVDGGHDGYTRISRGDDAFALYMVRSFDVICKPLIAAGILSQQELDHLHQLQLDLSFYRPELTGFGAWGRKPSI